MFLFLVILLPCINYGTMPGTLVMKFVLFFFFCYRQSMGSALQLTDDKLRILNSFSE